MNALTVRTIDASAKANPYLNSVSVTEVKQVVYKSQFITFTKSYSMQDNKAILVSYSCNTNIFQTLEEVLEFIKESW